MNRAIWIGMIVAGLGVFGLVVVTLNRAGSPNATVEASPVVLTEQPPLAARPAPPEATGAPEIPPAIEAQILRDAGDPGAKLRSVRFVDKQQQMGCGEIMRTNANKYARFVWLAVPAKVMVDDKGGGDYAQVAPLCYGQGAAGI
jgi:hypothetical protein